MVSLGTSILEDLDPSPPTDASTPSNAKSRIAHALRLTVHGPAQVGFLRYRPVLDNTALRELFGFEPSHTSHEAFEHYLATHPGVAR